jgi:hypothetical protein
MPIEAARMLVEAARMLVETSGDQLNQQAAV